MATPPIFFLLFASHAQLALGVGSAARLGRLDGLQVRRLIALACVRACVRACGRCVQRVCGALTTATGWCGRHPASSGAFQVVQTSRPNPLPLLARVPGLPLSEGLSSPADGARYEFEWYEDGETG